MAAILTLQVLIDELKQKGIKTKKYVIETILFGIFAGLSTLFGISVWVWVIVMLLALLVTYNLDNTHINFPKKFMASLTQSKRESLYKIERININKLIVVIILFIVLLFFINFTFSRILIKLNTNADFDVLVQYINKNRLSNISTDIKMLINSFVNQAISFINYAPRFYIVLSIYILFMELLAFFLRRKYDTKSTIMKIIFLTLFISVIVFNLNIYYFEPILTILLVLIAIVNTSNIYLNREERIKMLVA